MLVYPVRQKPLMGWVSKVANGEGAPLTSETTETRCGHVPIRVAVPAVRRSYPGASRTKRTRPCMSPRLSICCGHEKGSLSWVSHLVRSPVHLTYARNSAQLAAAVSCPCFRTQAAVMSCAVCATGLEPSARRCRWPGAWYLAAVPQKSVLGGGSNLQRQRACLVNMLHLWRHYRWQVRMLRESATPWERRVSPYWPLRAVQVM